MSTLKTCVPNFTIFGGNTEFHLDYFELPVTIGVKVIKSNKLYISPRIGYSLAYFLGGKNISFSGMGEDRVGESLPLDTTNFSAIDHTAHFGLHRAIDLSFGILYKL